MKLSTLFHKERGIYFAMDKIKVNLSQEKINFINDTYQKVTVLERGSLKKGIN